MPSLLVSVIFIAISGLCIYVAYRIGYGNGGDAKFSGMMLIFNIQKECILELRAQLAPKAEPNEADSQKGRLDFWAIYEKPDDFPTLFVARKFEWEVQTYIFFTGMTLGAVRRQLPMGLSYRSRGLAEDPKIIESWM
jgi:hypothetical protein